jgi:hypothetical protein
MQVACNRTARAHPLGFVASNMDAQAHTSCNRTLVYVQANTLHLCQCRASSTVEPVPRLEAALRMAQQCQSSASITGQSAAGGGATVDMAKSGPVVMAAIDERKRRSNRLQAHVPS